MQGLSEECPDKFYGPFVRGEWEERQRTQSRVPPLHQVPSNTRTDIGYTEGIKELRKARIQSKLRQRAGRKMIANKKPEINQAGMLRLQKALSEIRQGRLFHSWGDPIFETDHRDESIREHEFNLKEKYYAIKKFIYDLHLGVMASYKPRPAFDKEVFTIFFKTGKSVDFVKIPGGKFTLLDNEVEVTPFFLASEFLTHYDLIEPSTPKKYATIEMYSSDKQVVRDYNQRVAQTLEMQTIAVTYKDNPHDAVISLPTIAQLTWAIMCDEVCTYGVPQSQDDLPLAFSDHANYYGLHHMVGALAHWVRDTDITFPAGSHNPIFRNPRKSTDVRGNGKPPAIMTFGLGFEADKNTIEENYLQWFESDDTDEFKMAGIRPVLQLMPKRKPTEV